MIEPLLALTTGEWTTVGLLAAFTVIGLLALAGTRRDERPEEGEARRYIFGLGKIPRLRELPEMRDIPATPEALGAEGLRKLGKKADATDGLSTSRYEIDGRIRRPWELSADIPDSVTAIIIEREDGHVTVTREGHLTARPPLDEDETETFEELFADLIASHDLRADRRTWAHSADSPEAINARRV